VAGMICRRIVTGRGEVTSLIRYIRELDGFMVNVMRSNIISRTNISLLLGHIRVSNTLCLCYFGKLSSFVKYNLFHAYCTSYYGCELWSLSNSNVKVCVAWRKSLRHVWGLPFQTQGVLLPRLSQCLPVLDEICRCSLNFVRSCIRHESAFFNLIVVVHFGGNVVYCTRSSSQGTETIYHVQLFH